MTTKVEKITTVIAEYSKTAADLAELKAELAGKTYDVETTAGMTIAKADRRGLVSLRTGLEELRKKAKAPALQRCKDIDEEAKSITAQIVALESPIDALIKAEEDRKEAEKAEKIRIAAEAQKIIDDKIVLISKLPLQTMGKTAAEISCMLGILTDTPLGPEFVGENRIKGEVEMQLALRAIAEILTQTKEYEAAEAERLAEEARIKEERSAEEARLKAERAELEKQQAELQAKLDAQQKELDEQRKANEVEAARLQKIADDEEAKRMATEAKIAQEKAAAEKLAEDKRRAEERAAAEKAEVERKEAEAKRKVAEKEKRLAEAKCKSAAEAFKKILSIAVGEKHELSPLECLSEIAVIAEANIV